MLHHKKSHLIVALTLASGLSGCASLTALQEKFNPQKTVAETKVSPNWQAPLPHDGKLKNLEAFWEAYQDPLLLSLIDAGQQASASIPAAQARIAEARANRITANALLLPTLDAKASASKSKSANFNTQFGGGSQGANTSYSADLQAAWEIDLFGANRAQLSATEAKERASEAGWHDARVAVAAEVASAYFNTQFCDKQAKLLDADYKSKSETLRLSEISQKAGFTANGQLALAKAAENDAMQQLKAQQAQCEVEIKSLVALTDWDEPTLKSKLYAQAFQIQTKAELMQVETLPAQLLAQRPDVYNAEVALQGAAANIQTQQGERLPKISLNGAIGWSSLTSSTFSSRGETWSLGPVSITLPIFDGGKRKANVEVAEAQYLEAAANYRTTVRTAVKEVETALVALHSTKTRTPDLEAAIQSYQTAFEATNAKWKAGFSSLIELEESRRYALQAQLAQVSLQKDRYNAWVSLYRAAGGGWQAPHNEAKQVDIEKSKETKAQ